jgi:hypothetical protein
VLGYVGSDRGKTHGVERHSRVFRGTGGNKRRVSFITALTNRKLNRHKEIDSKNLRTIFHIFEMVECGKSGWTTMFKNFGTQPLCNIWVDGHKVRDICQYAGSLSDGYE